jgi:hypothetical protein
MLAGLSPGFQTALEVWRFDKLENIGGHRTTVFGTRA